MLSRLIGLSALALLTASAAHAGVTSGECRTDNTAGVQVGDFPHFVRTTSSTYVDVPDLSLTINPQGAIADCAFVRWEGSVRSATGTWMILRATIDGVACDPKGYAVANSDQHGKFETSGAQFLCRNLTNGEHVVKMQFRSGTNGLPVDMRNRGFSVGYKGK